MKHCQYVLIIYNRCFIIELNQSFLSTLTLTQREMYMEIVTESLRITQRKHFFSWLQGNFQALLPHEILVCGIAPAGNENLVFDYYVSTRYFNQQHFKQVTKKDKGIICLAMKACQDSSLPVIVSDDVNVGHYGSYISPFNTAESNLQENELKNIVAYGMPGLDGKIVSFFSFSRVPTHTNVNKAYLLQMLVPYLHSAFTRVMTGNHAFVNKNRTTRELSGREIEVLQWIHMGKSNWEIASILDLSPLTIKNHVQNILRKLDAQNRRQAAMKAVKLGFVKVFQ